MKRIFKFYTAVWAVVFVLFQVIAYFSVGWTGMEKYTPSFWIGYLFITVSFLGQLVCAYFACKTDNLGKVFYNLSPVIVSYTGLLLSFVSGGLCMLIPTIPYWAGIIFCAVVLAFTVVSVIKASLAAELAGRMDEKDRAQVFFLKSLIADAKAMMMRSKSETVKKECKRVYEAARYSDPVSHESLAVIEREITGKFSALAKAVDDDVDAVGGIAEEIVILLEDRNKQCKLLK